jgi:hypothetical protein
MNFRGVAINVGQFLIDESTKQIKKGYCTILLVLTDPILKALGGIL